MKHTLLSQICNTTKKFLLIVGIITITGCSDELDGSCSENIPLSANSINFSSLQDSTIVTTGNNRSWWLSEINVDGVEFFNFENVDVGSANFFIKVDSLSFERIEGTTILLKVGQNITTDNRNFSVSLQHANCFNYIRITQDSN